MPFELIADLDVPTCERKLLAARQPGHLAIGSDGSTALTAWAPSSPGAPPSAGFCRILLQSRGDCTRLAVSTCTNSLVRNLFAAWMIGAGGLAFVYGVFPAVHQGYVSGERLTLPIGYGISVALALIARLLDGRSLRKRVLDTIRRELGARAVAAEPRVAPDRAAPGR